MADRRRKSPGASDALRRTSGGYAPAAAELFPLVYDELRALAAVWLRGSGSTPTLQPTALVHEAYLKLAGTSGTQWNDRNHFFAVAARAVRQVLIDHARRNRSAKRGGQFTRVTIQAADRALKQEKGIDVLALDEALAQLEELDPRKSQIAELRLFAGMTIEAIATSLELSRVTVDRDWQVARAWMRSKLREGAEA